MASLLNGPSPVRVSLFTSFDSLLPISCLHLFLCTESSFPRKSVMVKCDTALFLPQAWHLLFLPPQLLCPFSLLSQTLFVFSSSLTCPSYLIPFTDSLMLALIPPLVFLLASHNSWVFSPCLMQPLTIALHWNPPYWSLIEFFPAGAQNHTIILTLFDPRAAFDTANPALLETLFSPEFSAYFLLVFLLSLWSLIPSLCAMGDLQLLIDHLPLSNWLLLVTNNSPFTSSLVPVQLSLFKKPLLLSVYGCLVAWGDFSPFPRNILFSSDTSKHLGLQLQR